MSESRMLLSAVLAVSIGLGACAESTDLEARATLPANSKEVRNASTRHCPGSPDADESRSTLDVNVQSLLADGGPENEPTCVDWERVGESDLRLSFRNVLANCAVDWAPRATFADGTLDVILFNTQCLFAGCSCAKGVDLTVVDLPLADELSLKLRHDDDCEESGTGWHHRGTLDLGTASEGTVCLEQFL